MHSPAALVTLAALGYATYYLLACATFPFAACRRCHGSGKHHNPFGAGHRLCRHCAGTGRRVRLGRRIYEYFSREHRRGLPGDPRPRR
ncbi:hypothetical protein [Kineosporia sp. NBRC 101731]|uniref:hypothetical protein n=1 Tax=Kineosporia sp. NBRC 101731 TaxID=3032199 RepID=UPI0024A462B7|nr:hypothetical protein [Kineosporia sp. NBRC 101731]GLY33555.1 hypothetical protein Kisp02_69200 [Kineosporia sp. NBRC 101731]